MFWSFFAAAFTLVATPALAASGGIHLEVHSPLPLLAQTTNSCDWTYQALAGDQWTFDVAGNIPTADYFMLMVRENGWGIDECPPASGGKKSCKYVCNATKHGVALPSQWQYEVRAEYRRFISSKTLCIQLNSPISLRFASIPSNSTLSLLDNVTLVYFVTGYPLPVEVTLLCTGIARINRTVGIQTDLSRLTAHPADCNDGTVTSCCAAALFSLVLLPEGSLQCSAWASNGLADVWSPSVVIEVISQPASTAVTTDRPWSDSASTSIYETMTGAAASAVSSAGIGREENTFVWIVVGIVASLILVIVSVLTVRMHRRKPINIHVESHAQAYVQIGHRNVMVQPGSQQADNATSEHSLSTDVTI